MSEELQNEAKAEELLQSMGFEILTGAYIDAYNSSRFDGGAFNPSIDQEKLGWTHHAGMMSRDFYVKDPSGESQGLLRTAWFYPDGVDGGDGSAMMVIEDELGKEIDVNARTLSQAGLERPST